MNLRVVPRSGIGEFRNGEAVDDIEQRDFQSQRREKHSAAQLTVPHSGAGGLTANRLTSEASDHTVAMPQDQTE